MYKVKEDLDANMNYSNPGESVPETKQNNRIVKERYRVQYHRPPFHNIPKVIIRYLDFEVVRELNYFPVKGGLSPYYSTLTIMDQQPLDH